MENVNKQIKKIKRRNKLYVRSKHGGLLLLDKASKPIFETILVMFAQGDAQKYRELNKTARRVHQTVPLVEVLPESLRPEFEDLKRKAMVNSDGSILVFGSSTALKFVELSMNPKDDSSTNQAK